MPKRQYSLEKGGKKRIKVLTNFFWPQATVYFDGEEILSFSNVKELRDGKKFELPNGKVLSISLSRTVADSDLEVYLDGKPLPGSARDPLKNVRMAGAILLFYAILNILAGGASWLMKPDTLKEYGIGPYSFLVGSAYLVLAITFISKKSKKILLVSIIFLQLPL